MLLQQQCLNFAVGEGSQIAAKIDLPLAQYTSTQKILFFCTQQGSEIISLQHRSPEHRTSSPTISTTARVLCRAALGNIACFHVVQYLQLLLLLLLQEPRVFRSDSCLPNERMDPPVNHGDPDLLHYNYSTVLHHLDVPRYGEWELEHNRQQALKNQNHIIWLTKSRNILTVLTVQ